ncbi:DUF1559 family PulG-like putative transporter [Rhodopirellula halodulae]|uniref:DUF1559 family PulG-like putative transporter n=1 Tax=Rhodopirellula halodulae TaxID=2894198 RepID=UPI0036F1AF92
MKTKSSGFTLVELLVVITIIGILMGLLIPAVNAARETARRNQCSTQIKNLSLAAIQYENTKGELPGYVQSYGRHTSYSDPSDPANSGAALAPHMKIGTWAVALMPWLDAQPTYEHWSEDRYPILHSNASGAEHEATSGAAGDGFHSLAAPNLAIMQCPSNPVSDGDFARNSYIANNGLCHSTGPSNFLNAPSGSNIFAESQDRANGVFNCKYNVTGLTSRGAGNHEFEGPKVRLDDFKDGAGNTLLFSESVQALPWSRAGLINASNVTLADPAHTDVVFSVETARYVHGMVWHYADPKYSEASLASFWNQNGTGAAVVPLAVESFYRINGGGATVSDEIFNLQMNASNAAAIARPSSAHTDGVNAAMADGGTRFIPDSIDYRVYQALLTPRGKSSNVPFPEYVLDAEAF